MNLKVSLTNLLNLKPAGEQTSPTNANQPQIQSNFDAGNNTGINHLVRRVIDNPLAKPETPVSLETFLKKVLTEQPIDENLKKKSVSIIIEPKKSPAEMTAADYKQAFYVAVLKESKIGNLPEKDLMLIMNQNEKQWTNFDIETLRKEDKRPGAMKVTVNRYSIELAERTAQAVSQYRQYQAGQLEGAIEKGNNYATDAVGGMVQPIVNPVANVANGITEPFRAGERVLFGTSHIPELPRMTAMERSEYWQKDGRSYANTGAEIISTILLGGVAGSKAAATQTGRVVLGTESAYNIGAGVAGKDATQTDKDGNAREMPILERGLRVAGGILGAKQTIDTEIAAPNSITNKVADKLDDINNTFGKPQAEMLTPEGLEVKVNTEEVPDNTFLSKNQEVESLGRRDLESHEGVSGVRDGKQVGHAILKHVGKSERWLQNRIRNEGVDSASSFYNKTVGNRTVGKFKKQYEVELNQWLKSKDTDPFRAVIDMKEDIGLVVNTNKKGTPLAAEKATKAEIILAKDNSEFGWHLLTVKLQK